jgi:hypothetical protein
MPARRSAYRSRLYTARSTSVLSRRLRISGPLISGRGMITIRALGLVLGRPVWDGAPLSFVALASPDLPSYYGA